MKNLFNQSDCNEILGRINKLTADTKPKWGKLTAAQMLTHAHRGFQSASGELKLKRTLMGVLFGRFAKKKLLTESPWGHNMPTDKHFVVADHRDYEEEKKGLVSSIQRFTQAGPDGVSKDPHPFFGVLTADEWARLMWKHLDHHLNQFGV